MTTPSNKLPIGEARVNEAKAPLKAPSPTPGSAPLPRYVAWFQGPTLPADLALLSGLDAATLSELSKAGLPIPVLRGASKAALGASDPRLQVAEFKGLGAGAWIASAGMGLLGMVLGAASLLFVPAVGPVALFAGLALGVAGPALGAVNLTRAMRGPSAQRSALKLAAQSAPLTVLQLRVQQLALRLSQIDLPQIAESDLLNALADLNQDLSTDPEPARLEELEHAIQAVEDLLAPKAQAQKSDPQAVLNLARAAHQARKETR